MKEGLVSIVTCVWDHEDLTATMLDQLMSTVTEPFELVIVDNGSKQPTRDLLENFKNIKPDTKVITEPINTGFAEGMNTAIKNSEGEYVIVISNDVGMYDKNWHLKLIEPIKQNHKTLAGPLYVHWNTLTAVGGKLVDYMAGFLLAMHRDFFTEVGYFEAEFGKAYFEDVELSFRAKYVHGYRLLQVDGLNIRHDTPSVTVGDGRLPMAAMTTSAQMMYRIKLINYMNQYDIVLPDSFTPGGDR